MSKQVCVIGCHSGEEKLQNVFRSMVRVFSQFTATGLKQEWIYSDQGPFDVHILDMDDESNWSRFNGVSGEIVVAISSHPELLIGQKYPLSKPLRSQSLLQIMQNIESAEPIRTPAMPATMTMEDAGLPEIMDFSALALGGHDVAASLGEAQDTVEMLFRLQAWPDLTLMPEDLMLDAARVCSLLAVRPASRDFISRFLDMPASDLDRILAEIRKCAHTGNPSLAEASMLANAQGAGMPAEPKGNAKPSSFLSKIWNRLKGAA